MEGLEDWLKLRMEGDIVSLIPSAMSAAENENTVLRFYFLEESFRPYFESLIHKNLEDQLKNVKKNYTIFDGHMYLANVIIAAVVCDDDIMKSIVLDKDKMSFEVRKEDKKILKDAIQRRYETKKNEKMTIEMSAAIEEAINKQLPMQIDVKHVETIARIENLVFEKSPTNRVIKNDFRDIITFELNSKEKSFYVKEENRSKFIEQIKKSSFQFVVEDVENIIKKPIHIQEIGDSKHEDALKLIAQTVSTEMKKTKIIIKKEFENFVEVKGKTFKVKPNFQNEFVETVKTEFKKLKIKGVPLYPDLVKAIQTITKNPIPIPSTITKNLASELAATSIVVSYAFDASTPPTSKSKKLTFSKPHLNIKRYKYFGQGNQSFKDLIEMTADEQMYTVKSGKSEHFLDLIKKLYELSGYHMHPDVDVAIRNVINDSIPVKAGIPGLHAEVLAVNNEMFGMEERIARIVWEKTLLPLMKLRHSPSVFEPSKTYLEEEDLIMKCKAEVIAEGHREFYVYTHKFGTNQLKNQFVKPGRVDLQAEQFPACHNCSNILKNFCNVHIKTGGVYD